MSVQNLFSLPTLLPAEEFIETIAEAHTVRVERIISSGQSSPEGVWYDQSEDEWVVLLQGHASLQWEDGSRSRMQPGDFLMIPAGRRHRVESTSADPPCIWLAVFYKNGA